MTPEQKAALTRLHGIAVSGVNKQDFADVMTVAELALTEHPADEDEAITPEWLKSVGLFHEDDDLYVIDIRPDESADCSGRALRINVTGADTRQLMETVFGTKDDRFGRAELHAFGDGVTTNIQMGWLSTRGDLRRLCHALGVELKES